MREKIRRMREEGGMQRGQKRIEGFGCCPRRLSLIKFRPDLFTAPKTEQLHVQPQQSTLRKKTRPPLVQWICRHETVETS